VKDTLFAEKYRPKTLSKVVGQNHILKWINKYVENDDIPHMLFAGPAGTGKTTVAKALTKDLYGDEWRTYYLEINASDETGVENVRTKVKAHARELLAGRKYRIVFFDEGDYLSLASQGCLRRIMEEYADRCRFIFSCNYPEKIIDPIKDRCNVFRFKSIKESDMLPLICEIIQSEEIDIRDSATKEIARLSHGSMRTATNILHQLKRANIKDIHKEVIYEITGHVDENFIKQAIIKCKEGDIGIVHDYLNDLLYDKAYSYKEVINTLRDVVLKSKSDKKLEILERLVDTSFRISYGGDAEEQLFGFMIYLMKIFNGGK